MSPSNINFPSFISIPLVQNCLATPVACVTNSNVTSSFATISFTFFIHLFLNSSSPTLNASSTINISGLHTT